MIIFLGTSCVNSYEISCDVSKCSLKQSGKVRKCHPLIAVIAVSSGLTYRGGDSVNSALY